MPVPGDPLLGELPLNAASPKSSSVSSHSTSFDNRVCPAIPSHLNDDVRVAQSALRIKDHVRKCLDLDASLSRLSKFRGMMSNCLPVFLKKFQHLFSLFSPRRLCGDGEQKWEDWETCRLFFRYPLSCYCPGSVMSVGIYFGALILGRQNDVVFLKISRPFPQVQRGSSPKTALSNLGRQKRFCLNAFIVELVEYSCS